MIPSAEFEKTANCCKTTILKTVHSHHSGKRKSKCKLQIAAKQNKKCLLVTIWRKKQITNCSKKITPTIQGKDKAKFKLQRNKTKNVSCHHLGKEKAYYKLQQKNDDSSKCVCISYFSTYANAQQDLLVGERKDEFPPMHFPSILLSTFFSCKGSISISDRIILLIFIFSHFIRRNFSLDILSLLD